MRSTKRRRPATHSVRDAAPGAPAGLRGSRVGVRAPDACHEKRRRKRNCAVHSQGDVLGQAGLPTCGIDADKLMPADQPVSGDMRVEWHLAKPPQRSCGTEHDQADRKHRRRRECRSTDDPPFPPSEHCDRKHQRQLRLEDETPEHEAGRDPFPAMEKGKAADEKGRGHEAVLPNRGDGEHRRECYRKPTRLWREASSNCGVDAQRHERPEDHCERERQSAEGEHEQEERGWIGKGHLALVEGRDLDLYRMKRRIVVGQGRRPRQGELCRSPEAHKIAADRLGEVPNEFHAADGDNTECKRVTNPQIGLVRIGIRRNGGRFHARSLTGYG